MRCCYYYLFNFFSRHMEFYFQTISNYKGETFYEFLFLRQTDRKNHCLKIVIFLNIPDIYTQE